MTTILLEVLFLLALMVANGIFAMAEMAVVSARKARLQHQAEEGDAKARVALDLAESPNLFLSTVQIGITLVGILAGAYGGATLADNLAIHLRGLRVVGPHSQAVSLGLVVLG